jgi:protoporphyrinogen/coproporphyrinogen III oxidase
LGCQVLRSPIAYPVFLNKYEADRVALEQSTGIAGLYSIGRNGEFSHLLMEDVYWRTQIKMREVRADLMQMQDNLAPLNAA